jgi:hypothetical protein
MATRRCPLCGQTIPIDAYYCVHCKRNLPTDASGQPVAASTASALAKKYKVCASCNKRIQIDDDKCWNCGSVDFKPLPVPQSESRSPVTPLPATAAGASVEAQLEALASEFNQWFTKAEIQHLPEVLHSGEQIKALTSGRYQGNTWLITVTDQRLLFLDKGLLYGLKQVDLPLHQISSLAHKTGLVFGELHIATSGGFCVVENIPKGDAAKVAAIVSALVRKAHEATQTAPVPSSSSGAVDVASQLERLAALMEKGILTKEEFAAQKAKLLSES